jgi:outer membrane lipoprotein SlyB
MFRAPRPGARARLVFALASAACLAGCDTPAPDAAAGQSGIVLAATPADQPGESTGAGAITGMVLGGVAGGQVGAGAGKALAIVGGIIAGQIAGSAVEAAAQHHDGMAYTIRLDNGQVVTVLQHLNDGDPIIPAGAHVLLQTDGSEQHVRLANS